MYLFEYCTVNLFATSGEGYNYIKARSQVFFFEGGWVQAYNVSPNTRPHGPPRQRA